MLRIQKLRSGVFFTGLHQALPEDVRSKLVIKVVEAKTRISKWVKISTPSIYKKVLQLEEKGLISSHTEKDGKREDVPV